LAEESALKAPPEAHATTRTPRRDAACALRVSARACRAAVSRRTRLRRADAASGTGACHGQPRAAALQRRGGRAQTEREHGALQSQARGADALWPDLVGRPRVERRGPPALGATRQC
jgi:hypothetical protein